MTPLKPVLLLSATLLMVSCETRIGTKDLETRGVELTVCREGAWEPWLWHPDDTDETIAQAKSNNAARIGWGCPP